MKNKRYNDRKTFRNFSNLGSNKSYNNCNITTTNNSCNNDLRINNDLQGHLEGTHFLILFLKTSRLSDCLASSGTNSHILGPRNESDSVPLYTECTGLV